MLPLTRATTFSYALLFVLLILIGALHLTTPFVAVMFSCLALNRLNFAKRKWLAVLLFLVCIAIGFYGFSQFARRAYVVLPKIVATAIPALNHYAAEHGVELPFEDMASLRDYAMGSMQDSMGFVGNFATVATKQFILLLIGIVVAVGIFLNPELDPDRARHPLALYSVYSEAVAERFRTFYRAFCTVIGAQVIISAINTFATSLFVLATGMRYSVVVIILTFLCGLLPVIGNLMSNTLIVGVALTISPRLAVWALVFLIVIHKLEYFLNSKIIGARIRYPMWLTLLALILGERLLGIAGIILAPVILNFIKVETTRAEFVPASSVPPREPVTVVAAALPDSGGATGEKATSPFGDFAAGGATTRSPLPEVPAHGPIASKLP